MQLETLVERLAQRSFELSMSLELGPMAQANAGPPELPLCPPFAASLCSGLSLIKTQRVGKNQSPYWRVGYYRIKIDASHHINSDRKAFAYEVQWIVGLQPQRNANGLQLLLLNGATGQKVAHLLMENTLRSDLVAVSTLLGVFVCPKHRQSGLAKHIVSIWLHLTDNAERKPITHVIRKPLLCLVLQHQFGFSPLAENEGIDLLVFQPIFQEPTLSGEGLREAGDMSEVCLFSETKNLRGYISQRQMLRENLCLCSQRPLGEGRKIRLGARFQVEPKSTKQHTWKLPNTLLVYL